MTAMPEDIEAYLLKIKSIVSEHTYYHRFSTVRCFYRYLAMEEIIAFNPATAIQGVRTPSRLPKAVPSESEVEDFLKKPKLHTVYGIRDRAMFELFYSTGLRSQELRDLKLEDLDLSQRVLTVREGKGGKGRLVPFGRKSKDAVEEYINKSRPILNKKSVTHLFLTDQGNPMSAYILRHNMNRYRDPENRTATPHSFRHACALHMLRAGASIVHLQQMLGHERITTTTIYTRLNPEDLKKAVKKYHPRELPSKDDK
jgi:site-specific recombinase XerD